MSVNYRELLKDYMRHVEEEEGVHFLEYATSKDWGTEEWEALKELLKENDQWYKHE